MAHEITSKAKIEDDVVVFSKHEYNALVNKYNTAKEILAKSLWLIIPDALRLDINDFIEATKTDNYLEK